MQHLHTGTVQAYKILDTIGRQKCDLLQAARRPTAGPTQGVTSPKMGTTYEGR